jgi:type II secretory pathway component GspD/PulD (secretin)
MRLAPAVALSIALVLSARGSARAEDPPAAADEVVLDFSKEMRVSDLLNQAARHMGRSILWQVDDKAITGKKIGGADTSTLRIPKRRLLSALRALLVAQEVVLIPIPAGDAPAYFAMDARSLASQYILKLKPELVEINDQTADALSREEGLFVTATISASNLDTLRDASAALRRLVTSNNIGSVQELPDAKVFVVTDFAPNVVQVWRTIRAMDAGAARRRPQVETIRLVHARAEKLVPVLEQLTGAGSRTAQPPGAPGGLDGPGRLRVAADVAGNTLVVVGSPEDLALVRDVVEKLDQPEKGR